MKLNKLLLEAMNREVERSRWALQALPADRYDWKPHDRSMIFGYLANMVIRNAAAVSLASDNVFSDGSSLQLATMSGGAAEGFTATLSVAVPG